MRGRGGRSKALGDALLAQAHQMCPWWHRVRAGTLQRARVRSARTPWRREVERRVEVGSRCGVPKTAATCQEMRLRLCFLQALRSRKRRRDSCFHYLYGYDEVDGSYALPDELQTCAVTGKCVTPDKLVQSEVGSRKALAQALVICPETGKRVCPDDLQTCQATGIQAIADCFGVDEVTHKFVLNNTFANYEKLKEGGET